MKYPIDSRSTSKIRILILSILICFLVTVNVHGQDCKGYGIGLKSCDSILAQTGVAGLIEYLDLVNKKSKEICESDYEVRLDNMNWGCYSMLSKGYYDSTIQLYKRIRDQAKLHRDTSYVLYMQAFIGNANLFKGDYQAVIDVMNEGYGLLLESNIEDPYLLGFYPQTIGSAYRYLGELELSLKYLDMALPVLKASNSDMLGSNYLDRADIYITNEDFIGAEKEIFNITGTKIENLFEEGWGHGLYRRLSKITASKGEYIKSIDLLELAESSLIDTTQWTMLPAIAMYEKASIHVKFANLKLGKKEILRAMTQLGITDWKNTDYSVHPNLQYVLSTLSTYSEVLELGLKDLDSTVEREKLDVLYQRIFSVIELLFQDFTSRRGASLWRDYNFLYQNAINNNYQLYIKKEDVQYLYKGLTYSVRSKSQELLATNLSRKQSILPEKLSTEIETLKAQLNGVKLKMLEAKVAGDALVTAEESAKYAKIKEGIKKIELPFKKDVIDQDRLSKIDFDELGINSNQAKLEIYESDDSWDVWTITSRGIDWSRYAKEDNWDAMATYYSKNIGNQYDFTELKTSLSFLTDIFCDLSSQGIKLITVVCDKTLSTMPLDLLSDCSEGDFSNSDVSFHFSYGLLEFSKPRIDSRERGYEHSVLAWAPTYLSLDTTDIDDELVAELVRSGNYNLPGAQLEALTISAILDGVSIMGEKATKSSFFKNIGKSRILHLSMHALINREEGGLSKFLFSKEDEELSSSFLHAFELEKLSLSAELAVLSACETGLGPIENGEGVMSLARSFAMAGVPSTVMTLWQVPDQSSSTIMTLFYRYLKEGQGKADALSQAKKEYVRTCVDDELKHPYYWAGFVLIGNNTPVIDTHDNSPFKYPLYVIMVVGAGAIAKRWLQFA